MCSASPIPGAPAPQEAVHYLCLTDSTGFTGALTGTSVNTIKTIDNSADGNIAFRGLIYLAASSGTSTMPEPGSLALLGSVALIALGRREFGRWRKRDVSKVAGGWFFLSVSRKTLTKNYVHLL